MNALRRMRVPAKGATPVSEDTVGRPSGDHVAAIMSACLCSCAAGSGVSYASPALFYLMPEGQQNMTVLLHNTRWFTAVLPLVAVPGALFSWIMLRKLGTRQTLLLSAFGMVCSWLTVAFSTEPSTLYAGRTIGGFCTGVISVCVPLYATEISPTCRRTFLGGTVQIAVSAGILLPYALYPIARWRWVAGACVVPPVLLLTFSGHLVDAPQWLLSQGRRAEADRTLLSLYGPEFLAEFDYRRMNPEQEQPADPSLWKIFKRVLTCMILLLLHQSTCANLILFYSAQIMGAVSPDVPLSLCTVLLAGLHLCATFISVVLMVDIGRRRMLIVSAAFVALGTTTLGVMDHLQYSFTEQKAAQSSGWTTFFTISFVVLGHSAGLGHIPWLLLGELMPQKVRYIGSVIAVAFNWCICFILVYYNWTVLSLFRYQGTFWAYGLAVLLITGLLVLCIPATDNASLSKIDAS